MVVLFTEDESQLSGDLGIHDLGGTQGWGEVPHSPDEPAFHSDWERRVFGLMFQVLRHTATRPGEMRYAIERLDREDYFDHGGYYGRWEAVMEVLLEEYGHLASGELDDLVGAAKGTGPAHRASPVGQKDPNQLPVDRTTPTPGGRTVRRDLAEPPKFAVGDSVVAFGHNETGHTRLPKYVSGVVGTVVKIHPAEVLPDSTAHDLGERPQHVLCVAYRAEDLRGSEAEVDVVINVDLYENYLTAAGEAV